MFCSSTLASLSFFFNDTATTEIYTLSLHDALPILVDRVASGPALGFAAFWTAACLLTYQVARTLPHLALDRKSTRLNSSHLGISYAVFCLKKKKKTQNNKK